MARRPWWKSERAAWLVVAAANAAAALVNALRQLH